MRSAVLQFMAGFCGALGTIFLLLSLGTDYWLLASESCNTADTNTARPQRVTAEDNRPEEQDGSAITVLSFHEGIFWRCSYWNEMGKEDDSMLEFWITNQPLEKICSPAFLPQVPLSGILTSDSTTVHRAFWCIMSVLGLTMVMLGVFVTICGIPMASRRHYEAGGALFITAGVLVMVVVGTYVAWVQDSSSLEQYVLQRRLSVCPGLQLSVHYGPSFMLAPAASCFCLLCGLLILLAQNAPRAESIIPACDPPSMQEGWQVSTL
ncbi:transmembrane protein 182-like [Astyanax mexicanus]|uniref:Transmembrane protein 182 n=1 Tax=Astyanax mexicanus TaxID=7994 RepID=A0A8T2M9V4_ASTMX|nr:transmembrane protein 182-like [Astyanax mexicanus]